MKKNSTAYKTEFPKESFTEQLKIADIDEWAKESNEAAISVAYNGIKEGTAPSAAYLKAGQHKAKERLALAGYRLAQLFERAYATMQEPIEEEQVNEEIPQ